MSIQRKRKATHCTVCDDITILAKKNGVSLKNNDKQILSSMKEIKVLLMKINDRMCANLFQDRDPIEYLKRYVQLIQVLPYKLSSKYFFFAVDYQQKHLPFYSKMKKNLKYGLSQYVIPCS